MQLVTSARYAILCHMHASYYASLCHVLPCILGNSGQEYPPTRARTWDLYDNLCNTMHDNLAYFGIFSHISVPFVLKYAKICQNMPNGDPPPPPGDDSALRVHFTHNMAYFGIFLRLVTIHGFPHAEANMA